MREETMVATTLTKEMIESGNALISKLDEQGLHPDAAFWLYFPNLQEWKLVIAEVELGKEGPKKIYKKIQNDISVWRECSADLLGVVQRVLLNRRETWRNASG